MSVSLTVGLAAGSLLGFLLLKLVWTPICYVFILLLFLRSDVCITGGQVQIIFEKGLGSSIKTVHWQSLTKEGHRQWGQLDLLLRAFTYCTLIFLISFLNDRIYRKKDIEIHDAFKITGKFTFFFQCKLIQVIHDIINSNGCE